ncbi:MAG: hypothetical protein AB7E60_01975 [Sphingobium sp.]
MKKKRPDGSTQIIIGWILFAVSLSLIFSLEFPEKSYLGVPDPSAMVWYWQRSIISSGLFGLSIILLSVGWIIRAIYFLPERDDVVLPNSADSGDQDAGGPDDPVDVVKSWPSSQSFFLAAIVLLALLGAAWSYSEYQRIRSAAVPADATNNSGAVITDIEP